MIQWFHRWKPYQAIHYSSVAQNQHNASSTWSYLQTAQALNYRLSGQAVPQSPLPFLTAFSSVFTLTSLSVTSSYASLSRSDISCARAQNSLLLFYFPFWATVQKGCDKFDWYYHWCDGWAHCLTLFRHLRLKVVFFINTTVLKELWIYYTIYLNHDPGWDRYLASVKQGDNYVITQHWDNKDA